MFSKTVFYSLVDEISIQVTNVIEIRNMLYGYPKPDTEKQVVFYQVSLSDTRQDRELR